MDDQDVRALREAIEIANDGGTLTQAQTARLLGISRQAVFACERRAIKKISLAVRADIGAAGGRMGGMAKRKAKPQAPERPVGRYREQHGVIVICDGEADQRRVYEKLKGQGLKVRVVVT